MNVSHSHLNQSLQHTPIRIGCFVPEIFKCVVGGVPLLIVKKLNPQPKPGVLSDWILLKIVAVAAQRFAIFLAGSLRRRMDSGVTSSISSGPMYSRARSRVI